MVAQFHDGSLAKILFDFPDCYFKRFQLVLRGTQGGTEAFVETGLLQPGDLRIQFRDALVGFRALLGQFGGELGTLGRR